jgi:hypothetical protein
LALKVAGKWTRWEKGEGKVSGRSIYNIFLMGSGLSVAYSTIGAKIITWRHTDKYVEVFSVPIILTAGTIVLWLWVRKHRPKADDKVIDNGG